MQAVVHARYGEPDVLTLGSIARPVPAADQVLIRVHAAAVSIGDHHIVTGKPYLVRLSPFGGLPRPRNPVLGQTLAGVVEAVGAQVEGLRVGDAVFGQGQGTFADYVVASPSLLVVKPASLDFEQAAALPWAVAALQGLRDAGGLVAGQSVLINGAAGGVGTWAVQIAKALGTRVTAVCSARNVELVRSLGADEVLDYGTQDFVEGGARFDLVFDLVGNRSLAECRSVLVERGTYVAGSGSGGDWLGPLPRMLSMLVRGAFGRQRLRGLFAQPNAADFRVILELVERGQAKPVIERSYPLAAVADALRHVGSGRTRGQIVLQIAGSGEPRR